MAVVVRMLRNVEPGWGEAMQAEFEAARESGGRLAWAAGCLLAAVRLGAQRTDGPARIAAGTASIALVVFDWGNSYPELSMAALAFLCFSAAAMRPRTAGFAVAILGGGLVGAHAISNVSGFNWPDYQYRPYDLRDWLELGLIVPVAIISAAAGAEFGKYLTRFATSGR